MLPAALAYPLHSLGLLAQSLSQLLLSASAPSPPREPIQTWTVPDHINVNYTSPPRPDLPSVFILATGGTIAGYAGSSSSSAVYAAGSIGVGALVEAVPELLDVANIYGVQVCNIGSYDMVRYPLPPSLPKLTPQSSSHPLALAKLTNDILCSPGSPIDAVVVTHGTDTLEETSFFLDQTVACNKPVVITGAMRPATAISADGPANLYQAVMAGVSAESKGRGCLVVLNDRIGSCYYTQKTHANYVDTFRAPEAGYLGGFFNNRPFYYYAPAPPTYTDPRLVDYLASLDDVKGLVFAFPFGGGAMEEALSRASQVKPAVMSSRINSGMPRPYRDFVINAGFVNTQKARILLQLALATGADPREVFEGPLRGFLA